MSYSKSSTLSKNEIVAKKMREMAYVDGISPTLIPENQPVYDALLAKAASYPPSETWKARAYEKAAETVASSHENIYEIYGPQTDYSNWIPLSNIGPSITKFISSIVKEAYPQNLSPPRRCAVPANQPIYDALLAKAASYPLYEPYKANAYRNAAASVATWGHNIYTDCMVYNNCYEIPDVGVRIEEFIYNFIQNTKKSKPADSDKPAAPKKNSKKRCCEDEDELSEEEVDRIVDRYRDDIRERRH